MVADHDGHPLESILLLVHVPRDLISFHQRFGVIVKKLPHLSDEANAQLAEGYSQAVFEAFAGDQKIWDNKVRIDNPMLCENDGPVYQLREWYSQFYMDVAEVPERFNERQVVVTVNKLEQSPAIHHVFE
jgi:3-ketosteroid 9alpha-monooxygenase subunit A